MEMHVELYIIVCPNMNYATFFYNNLFIIKFKLSVFEDQKTLNLIIPFTGKMEYNYCQKIYNIFSNILYKVRLHCKFTRNRPFTYAQATLFRTIVLNILNSLFRTWFQIYLGLFRTLINFIINSSKKREMSAANRTLHSTTSITIVRGG